ncbi:hypothetical protein BJY01DRAFT_255935 [Aspergillus pseudoustus]|uniref:C2H2-type domain-containing protein n=1 Tax=Aspergillus pseudoustus TaxID=1810923 RepID=A0ABR4IFU5_9EURO
MQNRPEDYSSNPGCDFAQAGARFPNLISFYQGADQQLESSLSNTYPGAAIAAAWGHVQSGEATGTTTQQQMGVNPGIQYPADASPSFYGEQHDFSGQSPASAAAAAGFSTPLQQQVPYQAESTRFQNSALPFSTSAATMSSAYEPSYVSTQSQHRPVIHRDSSFNGSLAGHPQRTHLPLRDSEYTNDSSNNNRLHPNYYPQHSQNLHRPLTPTSLAPTTPIPSPTPSTNTQQQAPGSSTYKPKQCQWNGCTSTNVFSRETELMRHLRTIHVSPEAFPCLDCSRTFGRNDHLQQHRRKRHGY